MVESTEDTLLGLCQIYVVGTNTRTSSLGDKSSLPKFSKKKRKEIKHEIEDIHMGIPSYLFQGGVGCKHGLLH